MAMAPLNQRVVHHATQTRRVTINQYLRGLAVSNDKTTFGSIANILNVSTGLDVFTARNNIILEVHKRVNDKRSMDALSTLLKSITKKDF
jgi:hypothetical protein